MKGNRASEAPRLLGIIWPFVAVVLFQALLGGLSLYALSAVRGYVGGESLWSKGQKDAIYYLSLYADSGDEQLMQRYRQAISVPQGDYEMRMALDQPTPDLAAARAGILKGGNHADDVSSVIWLYLNFRNVSYFERAIELWEYGERYLQQLDTLAVQMHEGYTAGQVDDNDVAEWKARIIAINDAITPSSKAFSDALGEASRMLLRVLLITNMLTALFLITLAWRRSSKLLAQRQAFASALQEEKERAQITLQAIGDAVITTDVEGVITYMNPAAEQLTHWNAEQAVGLPLKSLFSLLDEQDENDNQNLVEQVLSGSLVGGGAEHTRFIQRLDGSTVSVNLVGSPILNDSQVAGIVLALHDMTQERQYIANLSWQATHDALTGLANRREFEYRLELALNGLSRQAARHSLMFLDLDQFKLVNDTCGHAAGDELLRHICAVLQSGLREGDTLARLGGDEFGVLLENCPPEQAERIAEQLRQSVHSLHFVWKGRQFVTTVSVGVVHIAHLPATLEASLRAADMACYLAKEKGRNRVQVYHEDDNDLSMRFGEMAWVQRLHMALEENRFCLYAQEIAALGHDGKSHVEILLRLHDENGRTILPDSFIPAAERYGLMTALDRWVVLNVFKVIRQCLDESRNTPLAMCAINLSGISIGDEQFLDYLQGLFVEYRIPPRMICFEITETSAISNLGSAIRFITELKGLGCMFSLDDFCAGMSSFAYLKHLPVDFLKIDGSFVKDMLDDPVNRAMVEVINHIGHVMGKRTIAEFVETPMIEQALVEIGVDYAQGYLIERPQVFTCDSLQRKRTAARPLLCKAPGIFR